MLLTITSIFLPVCQRLVLEGSRVQRESMGVYHVEVGKQVNGRSVYQHECGLLSLFYVANEDGGYWAVGTESVSTILQSRDIASEPVEISAPWRVWTGGTNGWIIEDITVQCAGKI